jgi:lysine-N-methylase
MDGRCAFLAADDGCSLHALGGAETKPIGCRLYPSDFVDDGVAVRVAPRVECACVPRSAGRAGGEPLVPRSATRWRDLDPRVGVRALPDRIDVDATSAVSRDKLVAWSRRELLRFSANDAPDVAAWLASSGRALESRGVTALDQTIPLSKIDLDSFEPWFAALSRRASRLASEHARWRSTNDLIRRGMRWLADAAMRLTERDAIARAAGEMRFRADERLYVRSALHAYQFVDAGRPLARSLTERAIRVLVARAMRCDDDSPALAHPLALVEALFSGHAIARYADDVS